MGGGADNGVSDSIVDYLYCRYTLLRSTFCLVIVQQHDTDLDRARLGGFDSIQFSSQ